HEDDWRHWVAGANSGDRLDLMTGTGMPAAPSVNWRAWKVPLVLAGLLVALNLIGLHVDWWRMRSDANALSATMTQIFRSAFPRDPVVDPVAQLRQKLAAAKHGAGEAAPDDFLALTAGLGEVLGSTPDQTGNAAIAAL